MHSCRPPPLPPLTPQPFGVKYKLERIIRAAPWPKKPARALAIYFIIVIIGYLNFAIDYEISLPRHRRAILDISAVYFGKAPDPLRYP